MTAPLTIPTSQGTCQDTERSPDLTINRLPDEVLLEVFDYYRQNINHYNYQWREKYAWFNLAHVCGRWRAVMFASSFRLDLNVIVGPKKTGPYQVGLVSSFTDCHQLPVPVSTEGHDWQCHLAHACRT